MLDRASLRILSQHPERNDPALNVALAEEGDAAVLFALADCASVGPEALVVIGERIRQEGELVGHAPEEIDDGARRGARRDSEPPVTNGTELDGRLILHPRSDDVVRDQVLGRHETEPFFVLAAAAHHRATNVALERAARWPAKTAFHDRPWLGLIDPNAIPATLLDQWSVDTEPLARESAARLARDEVRLASLASDPSRRVRRAVASNPAPAASALRARMAREDEACEVRARATLELLAPRDESDVRGRGGVDPTSARFRDAALSMEAGGTLAPDLASAARAGPLDVEGARLAGCALDTALVGSLVATLSLGDAIGTALAAGIAFRDDIVQAGGEPRKGDLMAGCVRALAVADRSGGVVTGKGRLATWLAEGVASAALAALDEVVGALGAASLAADRMVLSRVARGRRADPESLVGILAHAITKSTALVPIALVELAWRDGRVPDDTLLGLASRARPSPKQDAGPEQEVDLDPRARPLLLLEKVGTTLVGRAPLSPRAGLALVALEPRRIRYVLSALPQWRGVLSGVNIARVLRAHAGALTAAGPSLARPPTGARATWTQRRLDEAELAVALAVGDLGPRDATLRIESGQDALSSGTSLAAAMEARAAIDGVASLEPLVDLLTRTRSENAATLAAWLITETLDRPRSAAAIAAALDAPWTTVTRGATRTGLSPAQAQSMVAPGIAEALATLERRSPGRLAEVTPQTPRGRAALASGIARAYRALGGMSVTEAEATR